MLNESICDQYHMITLWAQVWGSFMSHAFLQLTADEVLVFNWIAGSCQINLLEIGPGF